MTSRARRHRAIRGSGGGGGWGRGGFLACDFRAAQGRSALSGWGGPEETLRGPAALSVPRGRPRPSPKPPSDRVGKMPLPPIPSFPRSWAPGRRGGLHLLAQRSRARPSLLWAAGPRQAVRVADIVVQASAGADLLHLLLDSYLVLALGPLVLVRPNSACGDFGLPVAPLSLPLTSVRLQLTAWDWFMLLCAEVPPPCFPLSVCVGL